MPTQETSSTNTPTHVSATMTGLAIKAFNLQPGQPDPQINENGVRDYLDAARILSEHKAPIGPILLCRGQAVEIALKFFLIQRSIFIAKPAYEGGHQHHQLMDLYAACGTAPNPLTLTADHLRVIEDLHPHHFGYGDLHHPSRHRPNRGEVATVPGRDAVQELVETILAQARQ